MGNTSAVWIILLICIGVYFLPTIVAGRHRNGGAIFILNLLLGWTFIGWVVALVWAFTKPREGDISRDPECGVDEQVLRRNIETSKDR